VAYAGSYLTVVLGLAVSLYACTVSQLDSWILKKPLTQYGTLTRYINYLLGIFDQYKQAHLTLKGHIIPFAYHIKLHGDFTYK
jgi:hypothetical protein